MVAKYNPNPQSKCDFCNRLRCNHTVWEANNCKQALCN